MKIVGDAILHLNDRQTKIFKAIINDYLETGEPTGSRTISKKYNLGISSATIRNEMSDLEELGLIKQTHTSSGRVPSDKGYRYYVDTLMNSRELTQDEMTMVEKIIIENVNHMDYLIQETAKAVSILTNYATIITKPKIKKIILKKIQLSKVDETLILCAFVTQNHTTRSSLITTTTIFPQDEINEINEYLNNLIKEYSLDKIEKIISSKNVKTMTYKELFIKDIFEYVAQELNTDSRVYTSGINNILDFKEFSSIEKAKSIFETLEKDDVLMDILNMGNKRAPVEIYIGTENNIKQLKEFSIVKANYKVGATTVTLGIIAPTRMDYEKTVSILSGIIKYINDLLKNI